MPLVATSTRLGKTVDLPDMLAQIDMELYTLVYDLQAGVHVINRLLVASQRGNDSLLSCFCLETKMAVTLCNYH